MAKVAKKLEQKCEDLKKELVQVQSGATAARRKEMAVLREMRDSGNEIASKIRKFRAKIAESRVAMSEAIKVRFESGKKSEMKKALDLEELRLRKLRRARRRARRAYKAGRRIQSEGKDLVQSVLEMEQPKRQRFVPATEARDNALASAVIQLANMNFETKTALKENTVIELEKGKVFMVRLGKDLSAVMTILLRGFEATIDEADKAEEDARKEYRKNKGKQKERVSRIQQIATMVEQLEGNKQTSRREIAKLRLVARGHYAERRKAEERIAAATATMKGERRRIEKELERAGWCQGGRWLRKGEGGGGGRLRHRSGERRRKRTHFHMLIRCSFLTHRRTWSPHGIRRRLGTEDREYAARALARWRCCDRGFRR